MNKYWIIAAALAASSATTPARAQATDACTPIESIPATLDEPGNYCMTANATVALTNGAAITIAADNVTLDCRNYTLTNETASDTGGSSGILATSRYNLLVRNCRIFGGFAYGIAITQPQAGGNTTYYNRIENNYIVGPYRYGILAYGSAIEVRGNQIYDVGGHASGLAIGIRVGGATNSVARFQVVEDNLVAGTTSLINNGFGIYSDASVGAIFRRNTITGTVGAEPSYTGTGIRVAVGSANTVRDNHILGRGRSNEVGIRLPTNGGLCMHNRIGVSLTPTIGCDNSFGNYY
jgi:hypothetical protein